MMITLLILCAAALPFLGVLVLSLCWMAGRADERTVKRE